MECLHCGNEFHNFMFVRAMQWYSKYRMFLIFISFHLPVLFCVQVEFMMESCSVCSEITKYRCIICNIFICNRNPNCHVSVGEEEEGWQMGLRVALCHPCHNARNNLPNNGESSVINPGTGNTQESNPFTSPPTSSLEGLRKFEIDCASRGFHVYREIWNPGIGEKLEIEQDY